MNIIAASAAGRNLFATVSTGGGTAFSNACLWSALAVVVVAAVFWLARKRRGAPEPARSLADYRDIFDTTGDAALIHDPKSGEILEVSAAVCAIYGFSRDEIMGHGLGKLMDSETSYTEAKALEMIRETARKGELFSEWQTVGKDGRRIWNEVLLKRSRIDGREYVIASIRDVSSKRATMAEKTRLANIVENSSDMVVTFSTSHQLLYINAAGRKLLDWPEDKDLAGTDFKSLYPEEALNTVRFGIERATANGMWQGETFIRDRDGKVVPVLALILLHDAPRDEINYYSAIIHDLRQHKRAEEIVRARLNVLTRPEWNLDNIGIAEIFERQELQGIQDAFAMATGTSSIIVDLNGNPVTDPSNFNYLSMVLSKHDNGNKNEEEDGDGASSRLLACRALKCRKAESYGLLNGSADIWLGNRHVATWLVGQVRDSSISGDALSRAAEKYGMDHDTAAREVQRLSSMPRERFMLICDALRLIAGQLSELARFNIRQARIINELEKAQKALRDNQEGLRCTLQSIADGVIAVEPSGHIVSMNPAAELLTGVKESRAQDRPLDQVFFIASEDAPDKPVDPLPVIVTGELRSFILRSAGGHSRVVACKSSTIRDTDGETVGYVMVARDISKDRQFEERLRQSQKMDAVGKLAGGLAHEFNNLLQVILGYGDMLATRIEEEKLKNMLSQILEAGNSAKKLVRQLLAFSRHGVEPEKQIVDLNTMLEEFGRMAERLLGEHIDLKITTYDKPLYGMVDTAQLEQVLMNMCLNSRDAMRDGGKLSISLFEFINADAAPSLSDLPSGRYICCEVSDTGEGIPEPVLKRIFEPFFTTKSVGRGSGLGLAASYAIIRKHGGSITASSKVGKGTTFRVLLPELDSRQPFMPAAADTGTAPGKTAVILLVEDEEKVRNLARMILEEAGYRVITATNGEEGIARFDAHAASINLALLDVVLPRCSGREVAEHIHARRPELPVIFCSGYHDDIIRTETLTDTLIRKPYESRQLLSQVAMALGTPDTQDASAGDLS